MGSHAPQVARTGVPREGLRPAVDRVVARRAPDDEGDGRVELNEPKHGVGKEFGVRARVWHADAKVETARVALHRHEKAVLETLDSIAGVDLASVCMRRQLVDPVDRATPAASQCT